jgi:intracellular septation protein A
MTAIAQTLAPLPDKAESARSNSLIYAGKGLAADLLSSLIFAGLFAGTHDVALSIGIAIAAGAAQIAYAKLRGHAVDAMQWMSLGLVIVFGGASLMTHDPRFLMFKPSLIYCAVGAVMLKRGWMNRYVVPEALAWSADVTTVFGYLWAAMMFLTAGLNTYLVMTGDVKTWVVFLAIFPAASKLSLFAVQYLATRTITIRRMKAAWAFTHG